MMHRKINNGDVFGRLTVMNAYSEKKYQWMHLTLCMCGKEKLVSTGDLRVGRTSSCGCLRNELRISHGMTKSPEYKVWGSMIQRCTNPNNKAYKNYGGRGIYVCDEWMEFSNFYIDMGNRPNGSLTLERIDNSRGYSKDNCKWATREEQSKNTRTRRDNKSGFRGVTYSKSIDKFIALYQVNKKRTYVGSFKTAEEAYNAIINHKKGN